MSFIGESSSNKPLPEQPNFPIIHRPWLSLSFIPFYPYVCPHCHNIFNNSQALETHLHSAHRKECRDALEELVARTRKEIDFLNKFGSNPTKNPSFTGQNQQYFGPVLCPKPLRIVRPPPQPTHKIINLGYRAPAMPQGRPMANPPVPLGGFRPLSNINLDGANKIVYREFLVACGRSSMKNRKRGFDALSADQRDQNGSPTGASFCANGSNQIGLNTRNQRSDGDEANFGGELDLTLRL